MATHQPCVLVLDDAPEMRDFLSLLLSEEGYDVLLASSLGEAQRLLATRMPHLIVCDARLDGAAPFAAINHFQSDIHTRDIPLIVCTGAVSEVQERTTTLARAGVVVLLKPFDIDELLACVARLCGGGHNHP